MTTLASKPLTIEEYLKLPQDDRPTELVRGNVVVMGYSKPRHGQVCANLVFLLRVWLKDHDLGQVACNDTGVVTERNPDTLRGADVAYYSYARVPKGPMPRKTFLSVSPEIVFEVLSPDDRRPEVLAKVAEYLKVDVLRVVVVDPQRNEVIVYSPDGPEQLLHGDDTLSFPDLLPDFSAPLGEVFA